MSRDALSSAKPVPTPIHRQRITQTDHSKPRFSVCFGPYRVRNSAALRPNVAHALLPGRDKRRKTCGIRHGCRQKLAAAAKPRRHLSDLLAAAELLGGRPPFLCRRIAPPLGKKRSVPSGTHTAKTPAKLEPHTHSLAASRSPRRT